MCVCDSVGGGLLVQMPVCFFRRNREGKLGERCFSEKKGSLQILLDSKRVISANSLTDSVSHTVRVKQRGGKRPNEGRSAPPVIYCQIPAERISAV